MNEWKLKHGNTLTSMETTTESSDMAWIERIGTFVGKMTKFAVEERDQHVFIETILKSTRCSLSYSVRHRIHNLLTTSRAPDQLTGNKIRFETGEEKMRIFNEDYATQGKVQFNHVTALCKLDSVVPMKEKGEQRLRGVVKHELPLQPRRVFDPRSNLTSTENGTLCGVDGWHIRTAIPSREIAFNYDVSETNGERFSAESDAKSTHDCVYTTSGLDEIISEMLPPNSSTLGGN
ncbi:hypothetical protein KIN20_004091 [Parelaphostrongylus tenuis]|uniref:Uncharacterized protein n=1 Tax=Parelaphostrongylus tenuis TaxID=148309 RepID=A0AAD5M050_PARTN|nr:hypothetical protein KIN20_004091 [Parelaphostrongylus tenuis]